MSIRREAAVGFVGLGLWDAGGTLLCSPSRGRSGYSGEMDGDSKYRIFRPASVYSPNNRIVAIASKVTGTQQSRGFRLGDHSLTYEQDYVGDETG